MHALRTISPALALWGALSSGLYATDGYFDYGYGVKAKGSGGAGVAFPQDGLAPATNPAGNAFVIDQINLGMTYFKPDRGATLGGSSFDANQDKDFWIPEAAWRQGLGDRVSIGLAAFGNGGLNASYDRPLFPGSTTNTSINLSQLFVTPTATYKLTDGHALGASAVFAYQTFEATGLQGFGVQDAGKDTSYGYGARIGYTGTLTNWLTIGITYQSRTKAQKFSKYKGLFAEQGGFDIPANYAAGFAVKPLANTTVAVDVERILYSSVASVGNPLNAPADIARLGADNGPGFGWKDVTVFKLGVIQKITSDVTLRAGYNYSTQAVPDDQTLFNVLAPAVVQHHYTVGGSWQVAKSFEVSGFYTYVPEKEVTGNGGFAGSANLHMKQNIAGIGATLSL